MKARITFYIGIIVAVLSTVQILLNFEPIRFLGIGLGLFLAVIGLKIGWTNYKNFTVILGHIAVTIGSITIAYSIYQIPFINEAPTFIEVLDLPLFWGIFTVWGGNCMIKHAYCNCTIKMHEINTNK